MPPTAQLLHYISTLTLPVILVAFAGHLFLFFVLWVWFKRDLRAIVSTLFDFTRGLKHQSLLDSNSHLSDQVDAFLSDVNDVLDDPARSADRRALLMRMQYLDERRRYLDSMFFETTYNMARTMVEAYPLAGVLGTILAIGAALNNEAKAGAAASIDLVVARFGDAIWCTFAGLGAAIVLMFINSFMETGFDRLSENREHVRATVARAKRELALAQMASMGQPAEETE